ncbi:MAG: bifunctional phosphopantothenoylcysteine decarboxylase/phosphopantothenate--cysteine ligase CoaBC [Promethearchaeota archaeon]
MFGDHTSKSIIGTKTKELQGKKIALCITGSVAAIQCSIIARELMRCGAEVFGVMSFNARKLITPELIEWATGNPVITELTGKVEHVTLAGDHPDRCDLVLVAPATANTMSKMAHAVDDTPVTTVVSTAIGSGIPIVVVPAMHESLYHHPTVRDNIEKLEELGVDFVGPRFEEGKAKIAHVDDIIERVINRLTYRKDLTDRRVLVTAGATREYIDGIRFLSNPSSGRMGIELAKMAKTRGAKVCLIYGIVTVELPSGIKLIHVGNTKEMVDAVISELKNNNYDIMVHPAAVSDYGPEDKINGKLPSNMKNLTIKLKPLPKIVCKARETSAGMFLVGFKAEYNVTEKELIENAYKRLQETEMDLIVANDVAKDNIGFATETNEVYVIDPERNVTHIPLCHKKEVASKVFDIILSKLENT